MYAKNCTHFNLLLRFFLSKTNQKIATNKRHLANRSQPQIKVSNDLLMQFSTKTFLGENKA